MKRIFSFAAVAAVLLASCAKENKVENGGTQPEVQYVQSFKLQVAQEKAAVGARSLDPPATATVTFSNCLVMVFRADDALITTQYFADNTITTIPQTITAPTGSAGFPNTAKVLVIGNLPAGGDPTIQAQLEAVTNLSEVADITSVISSQTNYATCLLGNVDAAGDGSIDNDLVTIEQDLIGDATGNSYKAQVAISPMISRLELTNVTASRNFSSADEATAYAISSFEVTGIFLTDFYEEFNYLGEGDELFTLNETTPNDFTNLHDFYTGYMDVPSAAANMYNGSAPAAGNFVASTGASGALIGGGANYVNATQAGHAVVADGVLQLLAGENAIAVPTETGSPAAKNFGYNVVSKGRPNLIIRLGNIKTIKKDGTAGAAFTTPKNYYVRVTGYKKTGESAITDFERGKIYRISDINFEPKNISDSPVIDDNNSLEVGVTVENWVIEDDVNGIF